MVVYALDEYEESPVDGSILAKNETTSVANNIKVFFFLLRFTEVTNIKIYMYRFVPVAGGRFLLEFRCVFYPFDVVEPNKMKAFVFDT